MLDITMKVVLVFLILIVSISIVSEYICLKTIRIQENYLTKEQKIDAFLADLKDTLMKKENFESYEAPKEVICQGIVNQGEETPEVSSNFPEVSSNFPEVSSNFPEVSPAAPVVSSNFPVVPKKHIGVLLPGFEPTFTSFAEVNFS
jgi:Na+-transporting NADH:ubiquinone oxidoreductase subunit NqrC